MQSVDPLELEATSDRLRLLAKNGLLSEKGLNRALTIAGYRPTGLGWEWFINYTLLLLGTAFTLSGIFFFFAYNWDDLSRLAKFGLIEAAFHFLGTIGAGVEFGRTGLIYLWYRNAVGKCSGNSFHYRHPGDCLDRHLPRRAPSLSLDPDYLWSGGGTVL